MSMILNAAGLARAAHRGQFRKYTGDEYIVHPARVAGRIATLEGTTEEMVAAAFLHDAIEDTKVTYKDIVLEINKKTADLVQAVTNPSKGSTLPRAERKRMDRKHLEDAPREAKVIKLVDRIDNLRDLSGSASDFKILYARESLLLLEVIREAHTTLAHELKKLAESFLTTASAPFSPYFGGDIS